ncbi:hypothetical protein GMI70_07090 [Eggerthellaceae bacterium zg-893]|nr:hypothetical protein [Eggerthellaceae bacterium zg-893]
MTDDRAGGTSDSCGNPPAIPFSPFPESYGSLVGKLADEGFLDALTPGVPFALQRVNYRHFLPYLNTVKSSMPGSPTVKMAHDLLAFDRRFCSVVFKYIGAFELQLRAQYAHWMETLHGDFALYDDRLFLREGKHAESLARYEKEVSHCKDRFIQRVLAENGGRLPIAMGIERMTLGTLSQLYSNTADREVSAAIADFFGTSKAELSNWTKTITAVRNVCAHFEPYVVRKGIPSSPLKIKGIEYSNRETFYIVLLLCKLLTPKLVFMDLNLCYSYRLYEDLLVTISGVAGPFEDILLMARIPEDWELLLDAATNGTISIGNDFVRKMQDRPRGQRIDTRSR